MIDKVELEREVLQSVVLVKFDVEMIAKYQQWMQDSFLLEATCTEPMSLEDVHNAYLSWKNDPCKYTYIICDGGRYDESKPCESMIGDVNVFINEEMVGEINIMIAESEYRGKGIATEVLRRIISVAEKKLKLLRLIAKINENNIGSQRLFARVGFIEYNRIPDFEEIHYEYILSS